MKLFHLGAGKPATPAYAFVHDAYHPLPAGQGEGRPGSGILLTWSEPSAAARQKRTVVHAIAMDAYGQVAGWHLREDGGDPILESPDKKVRWQLTLQPDGAGMTICETGTQRRWTVENEAGEWRLAEG